MPPDKDYAVIVENGGGKICKMNHAQTLFPATDIIRYTSWEAKTLWNVFLKIKIMNTDTQRIHNIREKFVGYWANLCKARQTGSVNHINKTYQSMICFILRIIDYTQSGNYSMIDETLKERIS